VKLGEVRIPMPGGCAIGKRKYDLHIKGLSMLGAEIREDENGISAWKRREYKGADIDFYTPTVSGTENVILGACLARGTTRIMNANTVPEISDFAKFMNSMGAKIKVSSRYIEIEGVRRLKGTKYRVMSGNDEAVTYMIAAGMTGGEVKINNYDLSTIRADVQYLREAGVEIFEWGGNVYVSGANDLRAFNMFTAPYPGVNSDLQPLFSALALAAPGESTITDQVFLERFEYVKQLRAFGADVHNFGNCAVIHGGKPLRGTTVSATDLRGGTAMVLAGLISKGTTYVKNIYQIDRGYEEIEKKLKRLNADIKRVELS
jgi:UDP-N-acetylglucosamine 1-carboxyvinyltransferase